MLKDKSKWGDKVLSGFIFTLTVKGDEKESYRDYFKGMHFGQINDDWCTIKASWSITQKHHYNPDMLTQAVTPALRLRQNSSHCAGMQFGTKKACILM